MIDVISAGIVIADCVARPVEQQPERGQLALVDEISLHVGGSAANTGIGLKKLGLDVAVVGRVGQDGFGDYLTSEIARQGCDTRYLHRDAQATTSATLVSVDAGGERSFLHALGASKAFVGADIPLEALRQEGARLLHVAGFHVLPALEGAGLVTLFQRATELGLITSLDCVWDATGEWTRIHSALPSTDYFCPSLSEAERITGRTDLNEIVDALFTLGVRRAVALKMGEQGSFVAARDGTRHLVPAHKVPAVDGTGAGDAFIAGFLTGVLRGDDLERAGQLGNAAGALCVTATGAISGLRSFEETAAFANTRVGRERA